ncbi:hypothetical protein ACWDWO_15495 [Actinopolymorpha singaporensis]|uniref:Uncharacterized protein n=1 Tax=Actinopolymorpha singaporensis TaxID=117157 RepID=A0A1H1SQE6_9ACTN|nr:hypothetical protein [Actinopolymorpha singaporensis]SDS50151.1 hypothetical protein SAMN04489717_2895 [Actinopolymorpha singaporensis]
MAVLRTIDRMLDKFLLTTAKFYRYGRMRRSIEELERVERANGVVRSPRRAEFRRGLGYRLVDDLRFLVMYPAVFAFLTAVIAVWFRVRRGLDQGDWGVAVMLVLGCVACYFAWKGWFAAQWRYRWYPLFAVLAVVLEFGVLVSAVRNDAGW